MATVVATADPVYFECNDGNTPFEFFPLTQGTWTNVTVNWGDGSAPEFFAVWDNLNAISHTYAYPRTDLHRHLSHGGMLGHGHR